MKILLLPIVSFFLLSCTVYTEKQSEALSKTVYAAKDSLDSARLDLTDNYLTEASRIVRPPKERIEIKSIYKSSTIEQGKKRVLVVPEKYKNDTVIVVSSIEYDQLLKDKEVYKQIQEDNTRLIETKKTVDEELIKQQEYNNKMDKDLNNMQRKLVEKDLAILQRNIVIALLSLIIAFGIYIRFKGGLVF